MKKYRIKKILSSAFCLLFLATISYAQDYAKYSSATNMLEFRVSSTPLADIRVVTVFDSSTKMTSDIAMGRISLIAFGGILTVFLNPGERPVNLTTDPVVLTVISEPKPGKRVPVSIQVLPTQKIGNVSLKNDAPEGKDDSNVYISGEAIVERKQKPQFTLDIKLEKEMPFTQAPSWSYVPFLKSKLTNDDGAADKSNAGIKFIRPIDKFNYEGSAEVEADHKFRVANFITTQELKYRLPNQRFNKNGTLNAILFPRIFIGAELGRNFKSTLTRDDKGIARLKAGASLTLKIFEPFKKSSFLNIGIQKLVWENKFEQRWFLIKEQAYDTEDDKLVLRDFGRKPRGNFYSNLNFMFNDFFGPSLKYEWGQLPPLYKKVDHRLTFGLTFALVRKQDN